VIATLRNALPKQPWKFDAAPSVSRARGGPNAVTPESLETGDAVSFNEQETRFHLIDPVLRSKGYDDPQRIMLETPAPVEPTGSKGRRRKGPGRTDYLLCIQSGQMSKPLPGEQKAGSPSAGSVSSLPSLLQGAMLFRESYWPLYAFV